MSEVTKCICGAYSAAACICGEWSAATGITYGTSDPRTQPTPVEPAHLRGSDAFAVLDDEGLTHCVHRVRSNAEQCAAWFGAEVQEWLIHD